MNQLESTTYAKAPGWVARRIAGETIVVPVVSHVADLESIYTLNDVASTIWWLIDGDHSTLQIASTLCESYEVTRQDAERDVLETMETLWSAGLITPLR